MIKTKVTAQVDQKNSPCPICKQSIFTEFRHSLLMCSNCNVVVSKLFWEKRPSRQESEDWFDERFINNISPWVKRFEKWNNKRTISRLKNLKLQGSKLLEVGVGTGSFLLEAKKNNYNVEGCDVSRKIAERIFQLYGIKVYSGGISDINKNQFDIVVMNHVIEYPEDPIQFLKDVYQLIKPGAKIHVAVPNVSCLEAYFPGWNSYEPYHLLFYTPKALEFTIKNAGFIIEKTSSHESFSGWFITIIRSVILLLKNNKSKNSPLEITNKTKPKENTSESKFKDLYRIIMIGFGILTWPIRIIQASFLLGDELIIIAKRPG